MFILRQIGAKLAAGAVASLAAATRFPFRLVDVPPKYKLRVSGGKVASANGIVARPARRCSRCLESYTTGQRLQVCIKTNDLAKVVIVSPDHGTSSFLVNATNGTTSGTHDRVPDLVRLGHVHHAVGAGVGHGRRLL
jgi:hypothetical protein